MPARRSGASSALLILALAGCGFRVPAAGTATVAPSPPPVTDPSPTTSASPTAQPSPPVTPVPSPSPTPDPSALELGAFGCEGGVVLEWSPSGAPDFHHYVALRSPERRISTKYPPIAPAVDWGDSYATDRFVTSAVDASILPSETPWHYRVMAYDARGRVIGASPVRIARLRDQASLGRLKVDAAADDATRISWRPYRGLGRCFSAYRVLFSVGGGPATVLTVVSEQRATSIETEGLHPGTAYQLRVQAVRTSLQGSFVLGQSRPANYTVP